MKYSFPPRTLYDTICTPKMYKKYPGAPTWAYDGQFIWVVE